MDAEQLEQEERKEVMRKLARQRTITEAIKNKEYEEKIKKEEI